jgi:phosphatidylethanolamine/phosphatidyl-N-methylethanolamine N-methyltransferase
MGISLTDYAPTLRIVGVDYCEPMLRKAHERLAEHKLAQVEALAVMDAQHLGFPDAFFNAVVAQYVITTVPDPEAALDEFARVTKPGGEIILVNHLGAEAGPRRVFERALRRSRAGSAGGRNSAGSAWRNGPSGTAACACSSAAPCSRSGIFR